MFYYFLALAPKPYGSDIVFNFFSDEEKLFGVEEHTEDNDIFITQEYIIWEEFANVATNLLEKIEYFLDTFDQINIEVDKTDPKKTKDNSTNLTITAW